MRPGKHSIEDLMVQARRLELSTEEQCRLRVALDASQENRLLQAAGRGFDEESSVRPGDDELIARIAQRLESQAPTRAWRRWREPVLIAVGAMVLTTAAAGAWIAAGQSSRPVQDSAPVNGRGSATTDQQTGRIGSQRPRRPIESSVRAQSSALPPERGSGPSRVPAPRSQPTTSSAWSASDPGQLFAEANQARRQGKTAQARQLYQQLQTRHPQSAEAQHAHLTLAELSLQSRTPSAALYHFRQYRGEALAAEALWGQARALRQLGSHVEEQQVLRRLIAQYPGSAYADAARNRLASISE